MSETEISGEIAREEMCLKPTVDRVTKMHGWEEEGGEGKADGGKTPESAFSDYTTTRVFFETGGEISSENRSKLQS